MPPQNQRFLQVFKKSLEVLRTYVIAWKCLISIQQTYVFMCFWNRATNKVSDILNKDRGWWSESFPTMVRLDNPVTTNSGPSLTAMQETPVVTPVRCINTPLTIKWTVKPKFFPGKNLPCPTDTICRVGGWQELLNMLACMVHHSGFEQVLDPKCQRTSLSHSYKNVNRNNTYFYTTSLF